MQFLPDDDENSEHLRHKPKLEIERDSPYGTPARWYRIHVDYIPAILALADYYTHSDAHEGTAEEKELAAKRWTELQILLMTGVVQGEGVNEEIDDEFCEKIAECIQTGNLDLVFQEKEQDGQTTTPPSSITPTSPLSTKEMLPGCDPDSVYAIVTQLVDLMHRVNRDLLQQAIAAVQWAGQAELIIRAIPLVGLLPFDEAAGMINKLVGDVSENYNSAYTEAVKNEYYCDLFCLVMNNCSLDMKKIGEYFFDRFTTELFTIDWGDMVDLLLSGVWSGTELVHMMHALGAYSLASGFSYVGITPTLFFNLVQSFYNETDSDWEVLCDPCGIGTHIVLNFAETHWNFVQEPESAGSWESGEGHTVYGSPLASTKGVRISHTYDGLYTITKALATYSLRWGTESTVSREQGIICTDGLEETQDNYWLKGRQGRTYSTSRSVTPSHDTNNITIYAKAGSKGSGAYVKLRTLELWFAGAVPAEYDGL